MKLLVFGIHPDDIELGCGGTVCLAVDQGHDVTLVDLSDGASSSNGTPDERKVEAGRAAQIMGVKTRINLGFADGGIQSENLEQLKSLVRTVRETRPDIVLLPSSDDPHPDHASGGQLIQRAIYMAGVHGYQRDVEACSVRVCLVYPGRLEIEPDVVVDVTATFDKKMRAVEAHETQFGDGENRKPTPLNAPDFLPSIEARGRLYGRRIQTRYGEPFQTMRPIALTDFQMFDR